MTDVETIKASISNWLAALYADSLNPRPDYSIDGQTVSRAAWRDSLTRNIKEHQEMLALFEPFVLVGQIQ